MDNPFDQFDKQQSGNPFDQFDSVGLKTVHSPKLKASHGAEDESRFSKTMKGTVRTLSPITRPLLEGGGMVAGGAIGTLGGIETGPGAVITGLAGAGAGYALGKGLQDTLDIYSGEKKPYSGLAESSLQTAKDVGEGALIEGGGRLIGLAFKPIFKGGKWVFNKLGEIGAGATVGGTAGYALDGPEGAAEGAAIGAGLGLGLKYGDKALMNKAGKVLSAAIDDAGSAVYAKNAEEAIAIENIVNSVAEPNGPKLKFSLGQRSDNPATIMLERTQTHGGSDEAARLYKQQIADNNAALRNYYEKMFPGEQGIDDLISALESQRTAYGEGAQLAQQRVNIAARSIPASEPQVTGQAIVDELSSARSATKKAAGDLYDEIPNEKIDVTDMLNRFKEIQKPKYAGEEPENIPNLMERVIKTVNKKESGINVPAVNFTSKRPITELTLNDLRGMRSELLGKASDNASGIKPNKKLSSRYYQAVSAIEDAIAKAEEEPTKTALKEANRFFREDYSSVFNQRTVGEVLRKGPHREQTRIPIEKIPDKIWNNKTGAGVYDLTMAIGKEKTTGLMRDHAAYDLMKSATDVDGNIISSKLNQWYSKNKRLLERLGIHNDFKGIINAQDAANQAKQFAVEFERSSASKILGVDPESAIANAIKGGRIGKAAYELRNMVKGNQAAMEGLKKAFADHIISIAETTAKDIRGEKIISNQSLIKSMKKYAPAMRILYQNDPGKLNALKTIQKAFEISTRTAKSPIGGGSDTKELFAASLGKLMHLAQKAPVIKMVADYLVSQGDKKVNKLISRALFDPEYAEVLINSYRKSLNPKEFNQMMNGKIIDLNRYRQSGIGKAASVTMTGQYNNRTDNVQNQ